MSGDFHLVVAKLTSDSRTRLPVSRPGHWGAMNLNSTGSQPTSIGEARTRYFNREISWLSFNERVLAEASNAAYPPLERLRFLSISGSNLDEFMMIRVAGLAAQVRGQVPKLSIDGLPPSQQLTAIHAKVRELEQSQQAILQDLVPLLADCGIHLTMADAIDPAAEDWLRQYFLDHLVPVITPQAIDPAHPFPFVANQGIGTLFTLTRIDDGSTLVEMVLIPNAIPRLVRVPGERPSYIAVEQVISRYASLLFPGFRIDGHDTFRVLRDSDIEFEEEAEDLVRYFRSAIQRRRRGRVVLLEIDQGFDPVAEQLLIDQLAVDQPTINRNTGLIGINGLLEVVAEDRPDLKFAPYAPRYPERILEHEGDCFAAIREKGHRHPPSLRKLRSGGRFPLAGGRRFARRIDQADVVPRWEPVAGGRRADLGRGSRKVGHRSS